MAASLPKTMLAQVLVDFGKPYELRSVPLPVPSGPHDLLVKVEAASYCHTDYVLAQGQMFPLPKQLPHIGCHEFAGTIVAHFENPSSRASEFKPGDKVGVPGRAFHACGRCFECHGSKDPVAHDDGNYSVHCLEAENNGLSRDGGFAEYAVVDARQIAPLPSSMTPVEAAPLMCAGLTIFSALKRAKLQAGERVGIIGAGGGLGHLGLQYALKMGYKVLGVDAADAPLALANDLNTGARIVDARREKAADIVQQLGLEDGKKYTAEMGVDAAIILPESQLAFDFGMALLKAHGKCIIVSFPEHGFHFSARDIVFRDISIIGSLVGSNKMLREMLAFSAVHRIQVISRTFSLCRLNELVEEYHKGEGGKLVVDMSRNQ
ncbi:alcohol dehydrogenase-like protein [Westerdykella ornata]|uniref:Alcohol dehydrogenase-like protein n=1 Tax=Westerdykella ornata TaxID=318751 RepID=A0A6A6JK38_WESOR|nr:alcohol dehydrogenase-like protein [Westerdykella ornata]KAF2276595.1 alcohol dehydrogenase-like protein [Westerdykella ornata]